MCPASASACVTPSNSPHRESETNGHPSGCPFSFSATDDSAPTALTSHGKDNAPDNRGVIFLAVRISGPVPGGQSAELRRIPSGRAFRRLLPLQELLDPATLTDLPPLPFNLTANMGAHFGKTRNERLRDAIATNEVKAQLGFHRLRQPPPPAARKGRPPGRERAGRG